MDISPLGIVRSIVPQILSIIWVATLALFGLCPEALVQGCTNAIFAAAARPVFSRPAALLKSQVQFSKDWGIWGRLWISKYTIPKPENEVQGLGSILGVREALKAAIDELGDGGETTCLLPEVADVETEWTGYRHGVSLVAARANLPESEQYQKMMEEVDPGSPTILYFHGGAFCLMDPATHRFVTSALAKRTKGRCLSVRYRLSPQNAFPAALLDAFIGYLSLISPPPSAFHAPVHPSEIIISGDSSGAGLATSLMLLLLTLPRLGITHIRFYGRDVPMPSTYCSPPAAGLALASPWLDLSRALPSVYENARYDIIAPPSLDSAQRSASPAFPADAIWPTNPPRLDTYCEAKMVIHPLVSPIAAHTELWHGMPPVYISVGWEGMQDETEVFARRVYSAGSPVEFDGYEGMPHCFAMMPWNRNERSCLGSWANFCREAVRTKGKVERKGYGTWVDVHGAKREIALDGLGMQKGDASHRRKISLDDLTVDTLLAEQRDWRIRLEKEIRIKTEYV